MLKTKSNNLNSLSSSSISSSSTFSSSSPTRSQQPHLGSSGLHEQGKSSNTDLTSINEHVNNSTSGRSNNIRSDSIFENKQAIQNSWVPPNDRELIFRAKLKTGWSSRSSVLANASVSQQTANDMRMKGRQQQQAMSPQHQQQHLMQNNNHTANHLISDAEFLEIERVMQRANMIEQKEVDRIGKLYQRYTCMNRPLGNGETNCYICNYSFGILSGSPRICNDCLKHVCMTCSIDTLSSSKQSTIWLCKICAEYRDLLKKSGAWFSKRIPKTSSESAGGGGGSSSLSPSVSIISNSSSIGKLKQSSENLNQSKSNNSMMLNTNSSNNNENDNDEDGLRIMGSHLLNKENKDPSKQRQQFDDADFAKEKKNQLYAKNSGATNTTNDSNDLNKSFVNSQKQQNSNNSNNNESLNHNDLSLVAHKDANNNFHSNASSAANSPSKNNNQNTHSADTSFNLETSNKLLVDQIAASRNINTSNIVNSTAISHNNHNNNNKDKKQDFLLTKTSTINSDSLSNLSVAFQKYQPAGQANSNSELGYIQFSVEYIPTLLQLKINLISATDLPARDSNGFSDPYVKLHLLPGIAKATKLRSKTIYKNLNPHFNETFHYDGVTVSDIENKTLRLTVLDEDKFGFDFIGEYRLPLKTLMRNEINHFNVPLEEKQELGDETDTTFRGKINFALKYSRKNNCLHVKINRCTQLLPMDNGKSSDPFIEISLSPYSKENKQKFRTSVKWKTLDPEYLEEFKFTNIDLKTLLTKTIEISVWDKDFGKNDFIGVVQLGQQRTGEELKHFFTMIKNPDLFHEQWHTLHMRDNDDTTDTL